MTTVSKKRAKPARNPRTVYLVEFTRVDGEIWLDTDGYTRHDYAVNHGKGDSRHFGGTFRVVEFREVTP